MNWREILTAAVVSAVLMAAAPAAWADDASERFEEAFGERLRGAASAQWPERLALAEEMLDAARDAADDPEMLTLLCERAYELASQRTAGLGRAVEAMRLLAEHVEPEREEALARALAAQSRRMRLGPAGPDEAEAQRVLMEVLIGLGEVHEERAEWEAARAYYRRARAIAERIGSEREAALALALSRFELRERIEALRGRLARDRTDSEAAEELMRLLVVELDDPGAAREHRFAADDRELVDNVERASRDVAHLFTPELLELGDWYRALAEEAPATARPAMRARARFYYEQYLERRPGRNDAESAERAAAALEQIDRADEAAGVEVARAEPEAAPAAAEPAPPVEPRRSGAESGDDRPAGAAADPEASADPRLPIAVADAVEDDGRTNLFAGVEPSTHGVRGIWAFDGEAIRGGPPTPAQLILPWAVRGDYELAVSFTRTSPIGSVVIHIPVARRNALVVLGERRRRQRDYVAGLSAIDREHATDNATTTPFDVETGRRYEVLIRVEATSAGERITVSVDGEPLFEWEGFPASLGVANVWDRLDARAPGLGADAGAQVVFHTAHVEVLDGEVEGLE